MTERTGDDGGVAYMWMWAIALLARTKCIADESRPQGKRGRERHVWEYRETIWDFRFSNDIDFALPN